MLRAGLTLSGSAADYLQGNVKVDEYVTHNYKLAEINDGFDAMHVNGRPFVPGSCLTVLSRMAIASVLSSTWHKFQWKSGERSLVNCVCIRNVVVRYPRAAAHVTSFQRNKQLGESFEHSFIWHLIRALGILRKSIRVALEMVRRGSLERLRRHPAHQRRMSCSLIEISLRSKTGRCWARKMISPT